MKKRVTVKSGYFFVLIVAFLLCIAILRVVYICTSPTVDGMDLKKFASSRNTTTKTLYASRGTIYDSSGEALALSINSYTLIAYLSPTRTTNENNPQHVVDKRYTAQMLAPILGATEEEIFKYLDKEAYQVEFGKYGKELTETTKKKILLLNLPGLDFIEGNQRYYKMGDFASYIVGYAKNGENGEIKGELGIESYYNKELSGTNGSETYQRDAYNYKLPNTPSLIKKAENGADIYLTLDSNIQLITENALKDLEANYTFDWAIMTVMDAKTGAIVSSSTSPSFNPNNLNTLKGYLNPLVSYAYEPGSTMKIFSWASAIEEGVYDPEAKYSSGTIDVADVTIKDANGVGWGVINYDTAFAYSSNTGATRLAQKLGVEKLSKHYDKFGFGKKTGIELSGEIKSDTDFMYESELATASFGQGITITPIQMLQALTSITNDGKMLKPYIVDRIEDSEGNITYQGKRQEIGRVMKSETSKKMLSLMHKANYEGLSNMWQPSKVKMAMKTGTAQIASPSGGYLSGKYDYIYSLAGIFPYDNPKYIVYLSVKQIEGPQRAVASMATKAVDEISSYAKITDNQNVEHESNIKIMDNHISRKVSEVVEQLSAQGQSIVVIGDGEYVIDQYPKKGTSIVRNTKIMLLTSSTNRMMVDLTGWSLSDAKTYAKLVGINVEYTGSGYVVGQSIPATTPLQANDNLVISLEKRPVSPTKPIVVEETPPEENAQ